MNLNCKTLLGIMSFVSALATFPGESAARTWNILEDGTGEAPTIQAGIDSAAAGDTVLVHPGTYPESIDFVGKAVTVRSSGGANATTLNGKDPLKGWVVVFQSGENRDSRLEGFTVTGGTLGILINAAQPSVVGNIITENGPAQNGGGIWCSGRYPGTWFPLIQGNTVTNNRANNLAGGIGTFQDQAPEILDNYIAGNEARDGDGGGIYYRSFTNGAVIRGNTVINNTAGDHGGGIYIGKANVGDHALEVEVSWNLLANNYAGGSEITGNSGGGIWMWKTNAWVHHNTVVGNTGDGPTSTYGGGIVAEQPGSPMIEKNIIAMSHKGGGIWCGGGATPIIRNNLAWENLPANGVDDCPTWWQSDGNIVDDPAFCDAEGGNYAVASNSPAITHPAGPLGAFYLPGCGPVSVQPITWGLLKSRYLSGN